jgi:hypothetical protein
MNGDFVNPELMGKGKVKAALKKVQAKRAATKAKVKAKVQTFQTKAKAKRLQVQAKAKTAFKKGLRVAAAVSTGGASEIAKNKKAMRLVKAVTTGGISEIAKNKKLQRVVGNIATGGLYEVATNKKAQRAFKAVATGGLSEVGGLVAKAKARKLAAQEAATNAEEQTTPESFDENNASPGQQLDENGTPIQSSGQPELEPVIDPETGEQQIDENGQPVFQEKKKGFGALAAIVPLAAAALLFL